MKELFNLEQIGYRCQDRRRQWKGSKVYGHCSSTCSLSTVTTGVATDTNMYVREFEGRPKFTTLGYN